MPSPPPVEWFTAHLAGEPYGANIPLTISEEPQMSLPDFKESQIQPGGFGGGVVMGDGDDGDDLDISHLSFLTDNGVASNSVADPPATSAPPKAEMSLAEQLQAQSEKMAAKKAARQISDAPPPAQKEKPLS